MNIGWVFDESSAGQIEGINDAGVETFAGDHLGSLAREQGQNSMDAKSESVEGPVEIRYELINIDKKKMPGFEELHATFNSVEKFWNEGSRRHEKTVKIMKKAKTLLSMQKIPMLRISDRNTTGLRGSGKNLDGDWFALTKASGVSLKGGGKLGSFGIGKNVFWLNSILRTVFFSTHDVDDRWAFQGIAKLASHHMVKKRIARAIGFYGLKKGFAPIIGKNKIPALFRPDGVGTDIFLAGFDAELEWKKDLIAAFAENFFVAFHRNLLNVHIDGQELSMANIGNIIGDLAVKDPKRFGDLKSFYDALTSDSAREFLHEFAVLGKVRLRLLLQDGARKRIAMFRGTGMKIFEKGHFRTPVEFSGIFECINKEGNEFLRQLEPPSHNAWEPERYQDDSQLAKQVINELNNWLRDCVCQLNPAQGLSALEIPELERYLPDDVDAEPLGGENSTVEGDPKSISEVILEGRTKGSKVPTNIEPGEDEAGTGEEGESGPGQDEGDNPSNKNNQSNGGTPGSGSSSGPAGGFAEEQPILYRIFKLPGAKPQYQMRIELPTGGSYSFDVFAVGDDGRAEPAKLVNPTYKFGNAESQLISILNTNRIGPLEFSRPGLLEFRFEISFAVPLTLNAKVYRHG